MTAVTLDLTAERIERRVRKVAKVRSVHRWTTTTGTPVITFELDSEADIFPALGYSTGREVEYTDPLMVVITEWSLFGGTRVEVTTTTELTWRHIEHDEVAGLPSAAVLADLGMGWGDNL